MSTGHKKRRLNSESEGSSASTDSLKPSEPEVSKAESLSAPKPGPSLEQKPVFGASSSFGKASIFENIKNGKNVFDLPTKDLAAQSSNPVPSTPTTSFGSFGGSFGANSKFSNAFQKASQKKSFLDEPEVSQSQTSSPSAASAPQYKQVELTAKEVKTGEENEQSIFSATAKLFEMSLDKISEGWKERGVGPLHLNRSLEDPLQIRIVMRSHGLLRVILNYKITSTTNLIKGFEASLSPGKFLRINSVSSQGTPLQYLLKFSDQAVRDGLCDRVSSLQADSRATVQPLVEETKSDEKKDSNEEDDAEPATDVDSNELEEDEQDELDDDFDAKDKDTEENKEAEKN